MANWICGQCGEDWTGRTSHFCSGPRPTQADLGIQQATWKLEKKWPEEAVSEAKRVFGVDFGFCVAPWWKLLLAKIFGRRMTSKEDNCVVVYYLFNDHIYVDQIRFGENNE